MNRSKPRPRVAVVSPFLDKRHGTERIVAEWISHLADNFEFHVYSQRIEDIDLSKITYHRIPQISGPHLVNYLWWFVANHVCRRWQQRFRGLHPDVIFSPGINCLDAHVVSVHIVFAEYIQTAKRDLKLATHPLRLWPQLLHRKLYYRLIKLLEGKVYRDAETFLILAARRIGCELERHYKRRGPFPVIYAGIDHNVFHPNRRLSLRDKARNDLGYSNKRFVLLLIGNDWSNKGLPVLLEALESVRDIPIDLLVIGREDPTEYRSFVRARALDGRVQFARPRPDVEFYYAAADAYVGPSREDAFALPPAEAMACGLPVIVSSTAGVSEIVTDGVDGLILQDPKDAQVLASMIRKLYEDEPFGNQLAANAAETARKYTWDRNAREFAAILKEVLRRKSQGTLESLVQEP